MIDSVAIDCPSVGAQANDPDKRLWLIATGAAGGIATLATAVPLVSSLASKGFEGVMQGDGRSLTDQI